MGVFCELRVGIRFLSWTHDRYSDYSSIETYDQDGPNDFTDLIDEYEGDPYATLEQDAGYILLQNLQDRSTRTGLRQAVLLE